MDWPRPPDVPEGEERPLWLPKATRNGKSTRNAKRLVRVYCWGCGSQTRFANLTYFRGLVVCSSCKPTPSADENKVSSAEQRAKDAEEAYRKSVEDGALNVWTIDELDAVTVGDLNEGIQDLGSSSGRVDFHRLRLLYSSRLAVAKAKLDAAREQNSSSGIMLLKDAGKRHKKWYDDRRELLDRLKEAEAKGETYTFTETEAGWLKYPGCDQQTEAVYEHRRLQLEFIVYMHEYSMQRAKKLYAQMTNKDSSGETEFLEEWKRLSVLGCELHDGLTRYHIREWKTDLWCRQLHRNATAHIARELKHEVYFPREVLTDGHLESLLTFLAKQLTERLQTRENAEKDVKH